MTGQQNSRRTPSLPSQCSVLCVPAPQCERRWQIASASSGLSPIFGRTAMVKGILAGILQATALTRAARLAEATALIQRSLAGGSTGPAPFKGTSGCGDPATDVVIEGECSEVIAPTHSEQT